MLDLNRGGIKIDVDVFLEKLHTDDYLDQEAIPEKFFLHGNQLQKHRKVMFVKLKLKGTAL